MTKLGLTKEESAKLGDDLKRATGELLFNDTIVYWPEHKLADIAGTLLRLIHPDTRTPRVNVQTDTLVPSVAFVKTLVEKRPESTNDILSDVKEFKTIMKNGDVRLVAALARIHFDLVDAIVTSRDPRAVLSSTLGKLTSVVTSLSESLNDVSTSGFSDEAVTLVREIQECVHKICSPSVVPCLVAASTSCASGPLTIDTCDYRMPPPLVPLTKTSPLVILLPVLRNVTTGSRTCPLCHIALRPIERGVKFECKSYDDALYHFECITKMWATQVSENMISVHDTGPKTRFAAFCPIHIDRRTRPTATRKRVRTHNDSGINTSQFPSVESDPSNFTEQCGLYFV